LLLVGAGDGGLELGSVGSLARFDVGEVSHDSASVVEEGIDGVALGVESQAGSTLLLSRDAEVSDVGLGHENA
jgi:hypothetical protein